jgi:RND family efflux transporter MFP subunit
MTRPAWFALLLLAACSKAEAPAAGVKGGHGVKKLEYPVEVAPLEKRQVEYDVTAPGSIDAFQQVQITARVAGAVDAVSFTEGQEVQVGQVLATIESERYQVALDQARAQVAKAEATAKEAQQAVERRQDASKAHPGLIPGEELAQYQTQAATAQADVQVARQAQRVAELNLRDAHVRAPIAGVVQTRTVQTGQYLQPGAVLATILQRDPMLVRFAVSEQDAPRLKPGMTAQISLRESAHSYGATLALVAGAADPQTRLVPVTAKLDTTEHQYWLRPGAFCEVVVPVGDARQAIVVPNLAVQPTEGGNQVWVAQGEQVHPRIIQLGMHTPHGEVEVTRGLAEGELLVVRGLEPLSDGAPVKIAGRTTLASFEGAADGGAR